MSEIELYIRAYFNVEDKNLSKISELFAYRHIPKGEFHDHPDVSSQYLSFIHSGYFRIYTHHGQKEITQWISSPGQIVTDLSSFMFGAQSKWIIEAITDCQVYSISRTEYLSINTHIPNWSQLESMFLAKCFSTLEDRVFSFLAMTAEERYNHLFQLDSSLFNTVPLQYLASMMGMSPETLSRIRSK